MLGLIVLNYEARRTTSRSHKVRIGAFCNHCLTTIGKVLQQDPQLTEAVSEEDRQGPAVSVSTDGCNLIRVGGSTRRFTRGATTTQSQDTMKDLIKTNQLGQQVDITPIPLYPARAKAMEEARRAAAPKSNVDRSSMATGARGGKSIKKVKLILNSNLDAESASETEGEKQKATESKQSQDAQQKLLKPEEKKQDATNMSMQSGGLTSSLAETSEDEEAKRKAEKDSKSKKGPTEAEL